MKNTRIEITFKSGETITYKSEDWDDYAYDGKCHNHNKEERCMDRNI